jgi:hypothetical protein
MCLLKHAVTQIRTQNFVRKYQSSPIKQFTLKEEKYFDLIFVFRCFNSKMVSTDNYNRVVDKIGS